MRLLFLFGLVHVLLVAATPRTNTNLSPASYRFAQLGVGDTYYIDRNYTLTSIPSILGGGTWIKTANDDKNQTSGNFISFTTDTNVVVYVAYSAGASTLPAWLSSWTNTGALLQTTDVPLVVYRRTFPAGSVVLGGNLAPPADGSTENYVVIVRQDVPDVAPPTISLVSPADGQTVAGVVGVTANASDDTGIAGVQFFLDGLDLGAEILTAPYTVPWETRRGSNGFHTLRAVARDFSGKQTSSMNISVTVNNAPDTASPSTPANLTLNAVSPTQINLGWSASTDDVGVSAYQIVRNGALIANSEMNSYQDFGLAANTMYTYTVRAVDFAGNASSPATASVRTPSDNVKRIYLAGDNHTDYYWSADGPAYRDLFTQMLDHYLNQINATANDPPEYQAKWNTDGTLWLWEYERTRPARFPELMNRIKDGHITVPLDPLALTYGAQSAESALRGMYYAGRLERRFNFKIELAQSVENPGHPLGMASLWSGAGAKYTWNGLCGCLAESTGGRLNRTRDIYYWVGLDGGKLLEKWYSFVDDQSIGGYAEARTPSDAANYLANNSSFASRNPYNASAAFGYGWDDPSTFLTNEISSVARNWTTSNRKVSVSNIIDFFRDFDASYGAGLPTRSVSFGNERELSRAQLAERSARLKRSVEKLRATEALATLVSLKNPSFLDGRETTRDQAFMNMGLFFEHNWRGGGGVPISAWRNWIGSVVTQVEGYVNTLYTDAVASFSGMIARTGSNPRFFAFNPLSWVRTDFLDVEFTNPGTPFHLVDLSTGREAPYQWVTVTGQTKLRVFAQDVPSLGYKVFEVVPGAGANFSPAATTNAGVIENQFYQISVAGNGSIVSLIDKQRGNRQFVLSGAALNDLGSGTGSVTVENAGPVSVTLRVNSNGPLTHTTRVTLIRDSDRIDISNEITQNFRDVRTWRFDFNLTNPDVWHEEVGAVIRAKLATNGGHYSPTEARYDWLTLNHFADMTGSGVGVTLSNADALFMKLGNSTMTMLDTTTPRLSVLAGGDVVNVNPQALANDPHNQFGDSYFLQRFAIRTHDAFNAPTAMRFALQHQNPLIGAQLTGTGTGYPEQSFSFVSLSNPDVALWALKPAEEGIDNGIIARIWNLSASPATTSVGISRSLSSARPTTLIETDKGTVSLFNNTIQATLAPEQMRAFRLLPSATSDNTSPTINITAPNQGAVVAGTIDVSSAATDDVAVASVQFQLNGADIGPTLTMPPYTLQWSTATVANGVYNLTAIAYDTAGNHNVAPAVTFRVDNADETPPSAPTNLTISALAAPQIDLAWSGSSDNIGVAVYNVHRSTTSNFTPSTANRIARPVGTSYSDTSVAFDTTYFYVVTAEDAAGNVSAPSAPVSATVAGSFAVSNLSPSNYQLAQLGAGSIYYVDRTYTLNGLPSILTGGTWVKTANNDKFATSPTFLSFRVNRPVRVYVAYTAGVDSLPNWLAGWTDTGVILGTTDVPLQLYSNTYPAGTITLGGNFASPASGSTENYVVIIKESTP